MDVLHTIIQSAVVPIILAGAVLYAFVAPGRLLTGDIPDKPSYNRRGSAVAGAAAGLLLCLAYVLVATTTDTGLVVGAVGLLGLTWFDGVVAGLVIGLLFPGALRRATSDRNVGYLSFLLAAAASASLFNIYFSPPLQTFTRSLTLFAAIGILIHRMRSLARTDPAAGGPGGPPPGGPPPGGPTPGGPPPGGPVAPAVPALAVQEEVAATPPQPEPLQPPPQPPQQQPPVPDGSTVERTGQ